MGVKLYLGIEGRAKAAKLEITAGKGKHVVDMDREDAEVVEVAREYLIARGVLRVIAGVEAVG